MSEPTFHACDGSGNINIELTWEDAESGSHQGDCEEDCRELLKVPYVAPQK